MSDHPLSPAHLAAAVAEREALRRRFWRLPPSGPHGTGTPAAGEKPTEMAQDAEAAAAAIPKPRPNKRAPVVGKRAPSPWREPPAETSEYPGLTVADGRCSGSITIGPTRMPLWALAGFLASGGWPECLQEWGDLEREPYSWSADRMAVFLHSLFELRGEFARLLCVLADVERLEAERTERDLTANAWWERKQDRKRVRDALRACLAALGEPA